MRATVFAAVVLLIASLAFAQPSSLNALEQGLPSPANPVGGAAASAPGGYLGAELDDVGENGHGVRVKSVRPGTPAEVSGLKANDLIVDIDGKKITNLDDYDGVAKRPAGAKMVFKVDRGGRQQSLAVTLGTRGNTPPATVSDNTQPEPPAGAPALTAPGGGQSTPSTQSGAGSFNSGLQPPSSAPSLTPPGGPSSSTNPPLTLPAESSPRSSGITAQPHDTLPGPSSTPSAPGAGGSAGGGNASLGITVGSATQSTSRATRRGAYIAAVKPGSPAGIANLPVGGVIVQIDGMKINSDDELINAIRAARPGQEVELSYYDSADRFGKKLVRLGEAGAAPGAASGPSTGGFGAPGGGFGSPTAQNPGSVPAEGPARGGIGGPSRPLINRIENAVRGGGFLPPAGPTGATTVYDPLAMAALQRQVADLINAVNSLEERLRTLEGKAGVTSPPIGGGAGGAGSQFGTSPSASGTSSSPSFGSPQTPGFGSPSPSLTPGFAPSGTNP
ncbi:MAG TPA: PDZ domain-containing protein [Pirellulaceae bacterium]